jgi:hypothetical protein
MHQCIYYIDDLLKKNDKNIHQYLEGNLFVWNHKDDNHKLFEGISILIILFFSEITYEYNQYYYVLICEKIPNIHFHNVNNSIHQQLVDNNKNLLLDHMMFVMNQLNDNYNILHHLQNKICSEIEILIPGHPRRSKLGEIVTLSLQHPYGESKQVEPIDK